MRLTVLGGCGAWPEAGRAASGFLLQHAGFRVVLDLGNATLPRLLAHCPDGDVDAVVISHEHPDHCVDLNALARVRHFRRDRPPRVPLYCPPGVVARVEQQEPGGQLAAVFDLHELPGEYRVGPFALSSHPLPHHVPNVGVRLTAPDRVLAYTGDTGPDPALARLGRAADLFIVEATHTGEPPTRHPRLSLTAGEAGEWAARAGAKRLMLTHFWPGSDRAVSVAEARARFHGDILTADEDLTVTLCGSAG